MCTVRLAVENRLMLHAGKGQNRKTKGVEAVVEGTDEGASLKVTTKRRRAKAENTVPQFGMLQTPAAATKLVTENRVIM